MKIYIYVVFFLMIALAACMEDKGTYDYVTPNELQIDTILDRTVETFSILRVPTKVTCTTDKNADLSYVWYKYEGETLKVDTISREKDLEYKVMDMVGRYKIYYKVTDNKTGLSTKIDFVMNVVGEFGQGLMVLGQVNGIPSLVFVNSAGKVKNVYGDIDGSTPEDMPEWSGTLLGRNPVCVGDATAPQISSLKDIMVLSNDERGGCALSISDFSVSKDLNNLFLVKPESFEPKAFYRAYNAGFGMGFADFIIGKEKLYIRPTNREGEMGNTIGFRPEVAGRYDLCPYAIVCPAAYVFADNMNGGRLVTIQQETFSIGKVFTVLDSKTEDFDPSNLGMKCIYLSEAAVYGKKKSGYGVFRDDASGQLYGLRFGLENYTDENYHSMSMYAKTAITPQAAGIEDATGYAMSLAKPHMYYSKGGKVYFYGIDNNLAYPVYDVDTVAGLSNSVIDKIYMEYWVASFSTVAYGSTSDIYNKVLYVSSHKEGESGKNGTIHVVKLADNGTVESRTALYKNICGQTVSVSYKR